MSGPENDDWPVVGENSGIDLRYPGSQHMNGLLVGLDNPGTSRAIHVPGYGEVLIGDVKFEPAQEHGKLIARIAQRAGEHKTETFIIVALGVALTSLASMHIYRKSKG